MPILNQVTCLLDLTYLHCIQNIPLIGGVISMQHEANDKVKVAAIQLEAKVGDIHANLAACENMANEAGKKGAKWIILPEFFTTGMAFNPRIADGIESPNGKALHMMRDIAKRYQAYVGGSFIIRDEDTAIRNAFFLVSPEGILGRHNKIYLQCGRIASMSVVQMMG